MISRPISWITFVFLAIWKGIPFQRWSYAWNEILAAHEAETRKVVWELKKEGRIREDENGRLWSTKDEKK